tara:strand:+ start:2965 stop:5088 length:2124 start_codon:yes stop_codon:yes gene_type:complete
MDYDDYDFRVNRVESYAEDYTDDQEMIDFFEVLAEAATDSAREGAQYNLSSNDMEEGQDALDNILYLMEQHGNVIDFKELLDVKNNDGGEIWVIDLEMEVKTKVDFILTKRKLKEYCPNIDNFLIHQHDFLLSSFFNKDIEKYKEELSNLLTTEETTQLLLKMKKEIEVENFYINYQKEYKDMMANIALTDIEKKYVSEIIESKIDEEYNKKVNDEGYKENSEIGYDYSRLFRKNFFEYKKNKKLLEQNKNFKLENYKTEEELIKNVIICTFKQKNINNLNEQINFTNKRVNPYYKHLLKIIEKESNEYLKDKIAYAGNNPSYILNSYELLNISNKVIETFKTYKKYEELFKNYKKLPKDNELHFDILAHDRVEDIDDLANEIIEKNKTKLYAKRFLGSYMKLMDEESHKLFEVIREKDMSPSLIRDELSKIALFKTSENLNVALNKIIELDSLSVTKIISNIRDNNLDVDFVEKSKDLLMLIPNDKDASNALGSNRWCISNSEYHYNNYLTKGNNQRYHVFIYDFEKEESDPLSKIAITIDENKQITDAFNNVNTNIKYKINEILGEDKLRKIEEKVDYLLKNRHNYTVFRELKEEESVSHELIKGKADNILDFYTYLIETNKMKDFINKLFNSEKSVLNVIKDSITLNEVNQEKVIEFKKLIERENDSISIDLSKIDSLNIEDNSVKDFLSEKMNKTNQKKRKLN